jgi:hypothetical protein
VVLGVADVEGGDRRPRHDVGCAGQRGETPDRGDEPGLGAGGRLHRQDELGQRAGRVATQVHRHGARVPRPPREAYLRARGTRDRRDHPHRRAALLEHRTLLDVHLDVAEQACLAPRGAGDRARLGSERRERLADRHAVVIGLLQQRRVERPGDRPAPQVGGAETQALLVGEAEHVESEGQADVLRAQALHARHGDQHAERPVERPRVADAVQVRAHQPRSRVRVRAGQVPDKVARRIDSHRHARFGHPAADQRVRARHRPGGERPRHPSRLLGDACELPAAPDDEVSRCVHRG